MTTEELVERLETCLELQDELNTSIRKEWRTNVTINAIKTAYLDEVCEFFNEFPWKYWKVYENVNIDYNKVKLELVDAFHFILSMYIKKNNSTKLSSIDVHNLDIVIKADRLKKNLTTEKIYDSVNVLSYVLCLVDDEQSNAFLILFLTVCVAYMSLDELFKLYMLKNALNRLRQERVYTDKFITKDGRTIEDNALLLEIASELNNYDSFEDLYTFVKDYFAEKEEK